MFLSFKWHWFHLILISGLGDIIETVSLFLLEKLCAETDYSFDLFRGRIPSSVCSESCRKFSVDIQDVFTY